VRWDPDREDRIFFEQSAALHSTFYQLQMFVHRPFIPSPTRPTALHAPSLALCTGAARSCSRILGVLLRRSTLFNFPLQVSLLSFSYAQPVKEYFYTRYQHFTLASSCYSISGVASARDSLQIHTRTWNMFISAWIFLKQASIGKDSVAVDL
jgi:hypothetical protein